jgi:hypothetical protein
MSSGGLRGGKIILLVALGAAWPLAAAQGGVLHLDPSVKLGEVYTDNLYLAPPGADKEGAFITEIEPGLRLDYQAPRLQAKVNYRLQGLIYPGHGHMNHAYNHLNANATLEAVKNWFYVDARTIYDHQVINPEEYGGRSNIFGGGNRTSYSATTLSPYLMHDFGAVGIATLRYGYGRVFYSHDIPNVTNNSWSFLLARQPRYGALTYDLYYMDEEIKPDQNRDQERYRDLSFKRARLGLQYHISPRTALVGSVGKENNFKPDGEIDELGSTFWNAGVRWDTEKDHLEVLYGHRFFGASYEFKWHHDGRRFHTNMSYREEPTNYNRQLLGRSPTTALESPLYSYSDLPSLRNRRIYVLKRASVGVTFDLSNSEMTFRLHDEHRNYTEIDETDHVEGGDFDWTFALGLRDRLVPSFRYNRYDYRDGRINYYFRSQLAWRHRIAQTLQFRLALRNEKRNANQGRNYRVNTILVELTKHF